MKIDWTKVKEGFTTMDVLKEENKKQKEEIEKLNKKLEDLEKLNNANYQSFIEVNKIINELEKIIDIEMNKMGYAKYDSCLILMKMKIKELKGSE